jgi:glycogen debranching enzyme
MATYNPMSYHNGSIWPHDTSLAMAGLRAYGHDDFARELAIDLLQLSTDSPIYRLDELYCGFPPMEVGPGTVNYPIGPVDYPVSCSPQAWAAGAGLLVLRTLLGLRADPARRSFSVDPYLPSDWERMAVSGLKAGGELTNVTVDRDGDGYAVAVDHNTTRAAGALTASEPLV